MAVRQSISSGDLLRVKPKNKPSWELGLEHQGCGQRSCRKQSRLADSPVVHIPAGDHPRSEFEHSSTIDQTCIVNLVYSAQSIDNRCIADNDMNMAARAK